MKHSVLFLCAVLTAIFSVTAREVPPSLASKKTPLAFIQNKGQWPRDVKYVAQTGGMNAWITTTGIRYDFYVMEMKKRDKSEQILGENSLPGAMIRGNVVDMEFVGGTTPSDAPSALQTTYHNYFIGTDSTKWASHVPLYGEVTRRDIYKGIDARLYFDGGYMRYDFNVGVSSDPSQITMKFSGAQGTRINESGELVLKTSIGDVVHQKLLAYQFVNGEKKAIECRFIAKGNKDTYGFIVGNYDKAKPLVIDPIVYSTYIGGSKMDSGNDIGFDPNGDVVIVGTTTSTVAERFPVKNGIYPTFTPPTDAFVTKFKADLSDIIFSTYYGSSTNPGVTQGADEATCCAVDKLDGSITFGGYTFGLVPSIQTNSFGGIKDGFVAKITSSGSGLVYGRNLGGGREEQVMDIALVPQTGEAVVVGNTNSGNFPITAGAARTAIGFGSLGIFDGFVTKLSSGNATIIFSTYIGIDSAQDFCTGVALDRSNCPIVVGYTSGHNFSMTPGVDILPTNSFLRGRGYRQNNTDKATKDGFFLKLSAAGNTIDNGTLIGGNKDDECSAVDVDVFGNAVVCGWTKSTDIGASQFDLSLGGTVEGFALRIFTTGGPPGFISYLGGSGDEETMTGIKFLNPNENNSAIVVCGATNSADFPTGKVNDLPFNGLSDGVVIQLKFDGTSADYMTFVGGSSGDACNSIAVNAVGTIYIAGTSYSNNYTMVANKPTFSKESFGLNEAVITAINTCSVSPQAPKDTSVCAFVPLTLTNNATGTGTLRYRWVDESASSTTIGTNADLTFTPTTSTRIFLTITDDNCSKQVTYTISVKPIPTLLTIDERRTCIGTSLTLSSVAGDAGNTISWYDAANATTPVGTGSSFTTPALTKSVTYYVESTDTATKCTSGRKAVKITVVPVPTEPSLDNVTQCGGSKATLSAIFPSDVNFRWYDAPTGGNLLFVGRTFTTPTVINTTTSYYLETLDTTTNCTSVKRTEAKVIILPSPQPVITGQNAACVNSSGLKYTVASNPNRSYAWTISPNGTITNGNGTNQITVSWNTVGAGLLTLSEKDLTSGCMKDTTYAVTISTELSSTIQASGSPLFCEGDSIILDAGGGYSSYKWSSGETTQTITVKSTGTFSVDVADASGCKGKSNTVNITVNPKPHPVITGQSVACVGGKTVQYSVTNTPGNSYQWTVSPEGQLISGDGTSSITVNWTTAGTGKIQLRETGGICVTDTSFTVAVSSSLSPTVTALSKTTLCEGESVILDAGQFAKYTWSTGETTQTITVKTAGTYTVDVEDAGGCKGKSQPITVTVSALPTPSITANGKLDFCEGDSVILDAGQFATYNWSTGATSRTITVKAAGAYNVTVTNASGCTGSSAVENVTVYPLPVASTIAQQGDDSLLAFGIQAGNTLQWKLNGVALPGATGTGIQATQDGNYTIETTSPNGCKVTSNVFGYTKPSTAVLTVAVSPKTIIGAAGETVKVPLVITSSKNVTQATASSFSAELAVESTVLIPATGTSTIDNLNRRIITINGTRKDGNDTLAIVELKAGLGAVEVSPITLKSVTFTSGKAQVTTVDGEFKLTGICTDGGVRLFKPGSTLLTVATEPNPASDVLTITVTAAEVGEHKVYITNTLGAKESEIYSGEITGTQVIASSLRDIPTGVYFLCVQSPTELVVRRIVIAK
ncbi:MAG: T9SS type A sorting domain-containing protein [Candidatus Kapaibacterium sp.]